MKAYKFWTGLEEITALFIKRLVGCFLRNHLFLIGKEKLKFVFYHKVYINPFVVMFILFVGIYSGGFTCLPDDFTHFIRVR